MLCSGFSWILEQLPAPLRIRRTAFRRLSTTGCRVVRRMAGPSTARTPPAAAPTAARCGEDRALCIVTTTTTTTTTTILGLQQCAQEDVTSSIAPWNLFPLCSASRSVRGSCNVLIYSHRFSTINNFNVYCQLSMY